MKPQQKYKANFGEIDVGSSKRELRVIKGSSYQESTVIWISQVHDLIIDNFKSITKARVLT